MWVQSRSQPIRFALVATAVLIVGGAATGGAVTWNYMQHDNAFCTGCHIMNPAFQRFQAGDNKHGDLSCHDCHTQSLYASTRQLVLWSAERPKEIGEHAKVQNSVCGKCHVTKDTAKWQRIAGTAGHRVHLESDSTPLKGVLCVTCHGVEIHRFLPVSQTCGQSGCHKPKDTDIVLGKMAGQTSLHCAGCHGFTADVPSLATRDSARNALVPGAPQCLGCHVMKERLGTFDIAKDPHGGKCGTCHNAHTQKTPAEAKTSCANIGCHSNYKDEPFHSGPAHAKRSADCLTCHVPHQARVDASNCQGCHEAVRKRSALAPPLRFDTTKALRRGDTVSEPEPSPPDDGGSAPSDESEGAIAPPISFAAPPQLRADSFPHPRHTSMACITCHTNERGGRGLTFERPRGCLICHHQAPRQATCSSCHQTSEYSRAFTANVSVAVAGHAARIRPAPFLHSAHTSRACVECHTTPVSLEPADAVTRCASCHDSHHDTGRECVSCHTMSNPAASHQPIDVAHQRCDACHAVTTVARLTPTRSFCATCHTGRSTAHYEPRECTTCHFLTDPATYKAKIVTRGS